MGIGEKPDNVPDMVDHLHGMFLDEYQRGRNVVLIVDEAQNMPVETLEGLRLLSNLESSTDKLIQIVLVGQPEFAARLELPEMRQLRQRVAVRSTIVPFTERESLAYIEHRLNKAGGTSASAFTPGALREVVEHAKGVPRVINILCDNALVNGLGYQKKPVTASIVRETILDLTGHARVRWLPWAWASLVAVVAAGALFLASPTGSLLSRWPGRRGSCPRFLRRPLGSSPWPPGVRRRLPGPARTAWRPRSSWGKAIPSSQLAWDVYGFADERVMGGRPRGQSKPSRKPDRLLVGSAVLFPAIPGLGARTHRARAEGKGGGCARPAFAPGASARSEAPIPP